MAIKNASTRREKKNNEMIVVTNLDLKGNRAEVLTGERSTYVNSKKSEDLYSIDKSIAYHL